MGDGRAAAPRAAQRIGEQRPAEALARGGDRVEPGLRASRDDDRPVRVARDDRQRAAGGSGVLAGRRAQQPRTPAVATGLRVRPELGRRDERLAQREVQVDRAGAALERRPHRAAREHPHPAHPLGRRVVRADLEEPLRRRAVELDLVDRLAGADLAQLRRPVGGEDDERHARLVRLDDRRNEVRRRRAGRARDRDRPARRLRGADREEAAAALVDVREAAQPAVADEREHDRRAARPRRRARLAHAAARELVDERAQQEVGVGAGGHDGGRVRAAPPAARLHADGSRLGRGGAPPRRRTLPAAGARPARARRGRARAGRSTWTRACATSRGLAAGRFALAGYSMGGRIALHVALAHPERVSQARARLDDGRHRGPRRARARGASATKRSPRGSSSTRSPSSPTAGARSRCSQASRRRSPRRRARTGCATSPSISRPRCAGSARARWRRCGTASAS